MDPGGNADLFAVAELGVQRKPGPDRPWTFALGIEQELLAAADRAAGPEGAHQGQDLVARLDVIAPVEGLDTGGAFARAFVLGSAREEEDGRPADAAARTLLAPRAEARAACADALALAPSPAIGAAVARLLDGAAPALARATLGVLRFRRQAPYGAVVPLLAHPDAGVAAAAARCLGTVPQRRAAAAVLRHVLSRDPDDALALPAAEALLALGEPAGLVFVRAKLEAESAAPSLPDDARVAYLRLLGLAGDASDRDLFFRSVEPSARDATAVGWFGHPDLVDWLLDSLEAANEARHRKPGSLPTAFEAAAARALQRVLGPASSAPTPGADAGTWRALWASVRARSPSTPAAPQKLRFGRPYTPAATLDELEAEALATSRADAALELAIVSAGASLVETDDWVARQRTLLAAARATPSLMAGAYRAGAFAGARLVER